MEIKYLKQEKNEVEIKLDNLTIAEILRAYLNEDSSVEFAAWRREHPIKKEIILKIKTKGKTAKKALSDAVNNGCSIETARIWVEEYRRSLKYEPSDVGGGSPGHQTIETKKIYQACELCENPVEIQEMKIIRICPGCYKIIAENLKGGDA